MPTVHRHRGAARALLGAAALAASLAACSSGNNPSAEPGTSTTTTSAPNITTTTTAPGPSEEAVAAYRAFWQDFLAAGDPIDPESPRLAEHATGEQLTSVRNSFLAVKAAGQVLRGGLNLAPRVVSAEAATVVISDCYDDGTGLYSPDGVRQDREDPRRHLITATVTLVDGAWKVAKVKHEGDGCTTS